MATKISKMTLTMVLVVAVLTRVATSQSICDSVIVSLSPCLNYVTGNSSTPSTGCCKQLTNVVRSQPRCLCEIINGGISSMGITINQTQALALPTACNVQTPPVSRCNETAASPNNSPSGTSANGSKTVPSAGVGESRGSCTKFSVFLLIFYLFTTI